MDLVYSFVGYQLMLNATVLGGVASWSNLTFTSNGTPATVPPGANGVRFQCCNGTVQFTTDGTTSPGVDGAERLQDGEVRSFRGMPVPPINANISWLSNFKITAHNGTPYVPVQFYA